MERLNGFKFNYADQTFEVTGRIIGIELKSKNKSLHGFLGIKPNGCLPIFCITEPFDGRRWKKPTPNAKWIIDCLESFENESEAQGPMTLKAVGSFEVIHIPGRGFDVKLDLDFNQCEISFDELVDLDDPLLDHTYEIPPTVLDDDEEIED